MRHLLQRLIEAAPRFVSELPAKPQRRRVALLLAIALEAAVLVPFAFVPSGASRGVPSAIALAIATAAAVLVGTLEGTAVALAGAGIFTIAVAGDSPGGLATIAVWPALVLAAGLFATRVTRHRTLLEDRVERANEQLRALVDTGIGLNAELDLDQLLQQLVEAAPALTGARYAALGLVDRNGTLIKFLTTGLDEETIERIGARPSGRGVLGVLIVDPRPLRLADVSEHPSAVGFPPGHPPMRSFLGVPIALRGVAYGNLYLAEKQDGAEFTRVDEELLSLLAAQAAVAIENARLYETASRWSRQLESLTDTSNALAAEPELSDLLQLLTASLRQVVGARTASVWLPADDGLRIAAADGEHAEGLLSLGLIGADSKTARVFESGRPARVDSLLDDPEVDQLAIRPLGLETALWTPLSVGGRTIGVLVANDKAGTDPRFTDEDARLAEIFASRAAAAVHVAQRAEEAALRKVIAAQEVERRRLAIALHDGTAQALGSILVRLKAGRSPELDVVRDLLVETLQDVRRLSVELHPKALDDFGLGPALRRLTQTFAEHTGVEVHLEAGLDGERLSPETETALYRIVQEALENVAQHAGARHASVLLLRRGENVSAIVEDDGRGFDPVVEHGGYGLSVIRERVNLLGGRLNVESREGGGTTIVAEVPVP